MSLDPVTPVRLPARAGTAVPAPLFRDPITDGPADPTVIWNRQEKAWWIVYTSRRALSPLHDDVAWIHGTDLGVASSSDNGMSWRYRGILTDLDLTWGKRTYWAPEIIDDGDIYHMYVSVVDGIPRDWNALRTIRHYESDNLVDWRYRSELALSSDRVIDACVAQRPEGGWRLWYKDEADGGHTWCADSADLRIWEVRGPVVADVSHEGPNVFELGGWWWMITDVWSGQRVLRSSDQLSWEPVGKILDRPGVRPEDQTNGLHADVVVDGDVGWIFYFTHPGRPADSLPRDDLFEHRRSSLQVARIEVVDGRLICDRDTPSDGPYLFSPLS